ncbi:hypothetical protein CMV_007445, partial [Castanea mollissima]
RAVILFYLAQSKSMLMENQETRREEAPELLLSEQKISLESCPRLLHL